MHKFFCNYNNLTERHELGLSKGLMLNKVASMAENSLLPQIKSLMQELNNLLIQIKDNDKTESRQDALDQSELLLSNLFYSLFASPMEIEESSSQEDLKPLYQKGILIASEIEKLINIPEYNRTIGIIKSNLQNIFNELD